MSMWDLSDEEYETRIRALEAELTELRERMVTLIMNAPHGESCILRRENQGRVPCNCWKRSELALLDSPAKHPDTERLTPDQLRAREMTNSDIVDLIVQLRVADSFLRAANERIKELEAQTADALAGHGHSNSQAVISTLKAKAEAAERELAALSDIIERYLPSAFSFGMPTRGEETASQLVERICKSTTSGAVAMGKALEDEYQEAESVKRELAALKAGVDAVRAYSVPGWMHDRGWVVKAKETMNAAIEAARKKANG